MGLNAQPRDRPLSLPIQPEPIEWIDTYFPGPGGGVTTLTRIWTRGDTVHCRLCPGCTAAHRYGVCQVSVRGPVAAADLPLLSLRGREIVAPPDRAHDRVVGAHHGDAVG